ncbi:IS1/IS1595 family N-terminal zinc-binding domain-containing protein [Candidatus Methanarcanum hacksteinii]|uniref:IS1/IS1595 family N-terminal zinc-binding domain-containing protein n=1 Tax=Candidatus Methanarcanum hacksteinii TaxID=2911857 RepID=UPI0037DBF3DF
MVDNVIRREMFGIGDEGSKTICPFCGSASFTKYGHNSAGKQRYHCKECDSYFIDRPTGSIIFYTKLPFETWSRLTECFVDRLSCMKTARKISVTTKSA